MVVPDKFSTDSLLCRNLLYVYETAISGSCSSIMILSWLISADVYTLAGRR